MVMAIPKSILNLLMLPKVRRGQNQGQDLQIRRARKRVEVEAARTIKESSPSYKRTSQVSDDSDCTEETRLVADGCPGCPAAEDQSSGAPVIQRIAVSRDQN